ncbi:MAG: hypothetical protein PWP04_422 [Candidatus Atribacteria bacterium]|nr:hypothetical protein [Candidatus Atribacteria bacterium]
MIKSWYWMKSFLSNLLRWEEEKKAKNFLPLYLGLVIGFGVLVYGWSISTLIPSFSAFPLFLLVFSCLTFLAELLPVSLAHRASISVSFAIVYAVILIDSPPAAAFVAFTGMGLATVRSGWYKSLFNASQFGISALLSSLVYQWLGGYQFSWHHPAFYGAVFGSIVVFFLLNSLLVAGAISLSEGLSLFSFWKKDMRGVSLQYFALFPFSLLLYLVYLYVGYPGLALFLFPFLVARYSFKLYVETKNAHLELLRVLMAAVDAKDPYTQGHSRRVSELALALAEELGLSGQQKETIEYAALLHDVGKIGIKDTILAKPGKLNQLEYGEIQQHPVIGYEIVTNVAFLKKVAEIIRDHHERVNGSGYPDGRRGEGISLEAKIVGVSDVFDALTSDRPYRPAYSPVEALQVMEEEEQGRFDPLVMEALKKVLRKKGNVG